MFLFGCCFIGADCFPNAHGHFLLRLVSGDVAIQGEGVGGGGGGVVEGE